MGRPHNLVMLHFALRVSPVVPQIPSPIAQGKLFASPEEWLLSDDAEEYEAKLRRHPLSKA